MRNIFFYILGIFLLLSPGFVYSEPLPELGARALGMGSSYVAVGEGMLARYWNPASAIQGFNGFGIQVNAGTGLDFTGGILNFTEGIEQAMGSLGAIQESLDGGALNFEAVAAFFTLMEGLNDLNDPNKGILSQTPTGVSVCIGPVTLAANEYFSIGVDPNIDLDNIGFGIFSNSSFSSFMAPRVKTYGKKSSRQPSFSAAADFTPELWAAQSDLVTIIDYLIAEGELDPSDYPEFEGYTSSDIAHELINGALDDELLSPEEIIDMVDQVTELLPLVDNLLNSSSGSFGDNTSNFTIKALGVMEMSLGYSSPCGFLDGTFLSGLVFGINFKSLQGYTGYYKMGISSATSDLPTGLDDVVISNRLGLDLGFLLDRKEENHFRIGLLCRNVNTPKFEVSSEAHSDGISYYELYPQMRLGLAFWPFRFWAIAADMDLTRNTTFIKDYYSQMVGLGTEFNVLNRDPFANISIRLGAKYNTATNGDINEAISNNKLIYTAGVGVNLATVGIDLAATFNNDRVYLDSPVLQEMLGASLAMDGIPPGLQVALSVSVKFGTFGAKKAAEAYQPDYGGYRDFGRRRSERYSEDYYSEYDEIMNIMPLLFILPSYNQPPAAGSGSSQSPAQSSPQSPAIQPSPQSNPPPAKNSSNNNSQGYNPYEFLGQ